MNKSAIAVEMRGIYKEFPGVRANDGVEFETRWGEIHALLGENGAGKTTLMKILSGIYQPDTGEIFIDGQPVKIKSPKDAIALGVGMVHQHFSLVDVLTVTENVTLGGSQPRIWLNENELARQIQDLSKHYGLHINPKASIWQLSLGEQQRVEIIKLLYRGMGILILDEPTSVLTPQEVDSFLLTLRSLANEGKSIIIITHKLDEVLKIADRITVLRAGKKVDTVNTRDTTKPQLARMMVNQEIDLFPVRPKERTTETGNLVLKLEKVHAYSDRGLLALKDVSLEVRTSEIVGVAGVSGNGQTELAEVICGLRKPTSGQVIINGDPEASRTPISAINSGVGHVPEDRLGVGLVASLSVRENLILKGYRKPPLSGRFSLNHKSIDAFTKRLIQMFGITPPNPDTPVTLLSGGNQQKVILSREITSDSKLLVAVHPTIGLDIGATEFVRTTLHEQRCSGAAVLLISEDLDELLELSDRMAIMYDGQIIGVVRPGEIDIEKIGLMMAGEQIALE